MTPHEVAARLRGTPAPWYVVAGWAVDLFVGEQTRDHEDLEIATPADAFEDVRRALSFLDFFVVGDGHRYPLEPAAMSEHFQTWGWDAERSAYVLDVFRDPGGSGEWVCRRAPGIRRPLDEVVRRDRQGIPYLAPEAVMLFKAKHCRDKDERDWGVVRPRLDARQRAWLLDALDLVHPGHRWADELRSRS